MDAVGDEVQVQPATTVEVVLDLEAALKRALKSALIADGLSKGLHEAAKALDKREAHFCIMAEDCDEPMYTKLVEALCNEHSISLLKIKEKKKLGEWIGLCKYDKERKARKVVGCSCAVVRDYGQDEAARLFLEDHFQKTKRS